MPAMIMQHDIDPKAELLRKVGKLKGIEIFHNKVLVAVYQRPEKTKSGIILTDNNRSEDKFQSKVGLILKHGARAFVTDKDWNFDGLNLSVGDWILMRATDGWQIDVIGTEKVECRILNDVQILGRIDHPDLVW